MLQFIPVKGKKEDYPEIKDVIYLDDSTGNSMTKKYRYAVEHYVKDNTWYCFRHNDLRIVSPFEEFEEALKRQVPDNIAICGVIGTLNMERTFTWWTPHREVNGVGSIRQTILKEDNPNKDKFYTMNDWPGYHEGLASVDGCIMFIHKRLFDAGANWDTKIKDFQFYDVDICLQALEHQFGIATVPLVVQHDSAGITPKNFDVLRVYVENKWAKKVNDVFPINRFSKFQ